MAKAPRKKESGIRNPERRNGKAWKKGKSPTQREAERQAKTANV